MNLLSKLNFSSLILLLKKMRHLFFNCIEFKYNEFGVLLPKYYIDIILMYA